jgi:hypothetical protein
MKNERKLFSLAAGVSISILAAPLGSLAQMKYSPADAALVKSYTLTDDKVHRWIQANRSIQHDRRSNAALEAENKDKDQPATFQAMMAMIKHEPVSMSYFHKVGLSDSDAVLIPAALSNAMIVAAAPNLGAQLPTTPAQINYVKTHPAEMKALQGAN